MSGAGGFSVFNAAQNDLSDDWKSFLTTASIAPTVDASSKVPNLTLVHNGFGGLNFDTKTTNSRFIRDDYNVANSVLLAMSAGTSSNPPPTLGSIITALNIPVGIRQADNMANDIINALGTGIGLSVDGTELRNAMWLTKGSTLRLDTALSFTPTLNDHGILDTIESKIHTNYGISLSDKIPIPTIMIQQTCQGTRFSDQNGNSQWYLTRTFRLTFKITTSGFVFWISLDARGISFSMTQDPADDIDSDSLWGKMNSLGGDGLSKSSAMPIFDKILSDVRLLKLSVGKDGPSSKPWWQVDVGLLLVRSDGNPKGKDPVEIYLSYDSRSQTFLGGLILAGYYATANGKLLPTYVAGQQVDEPKGQTYPPFWDLKQASTELDSVPSSLPTAIAVASVSYQTNPSQLCFRAILVRTSASAPGHSVPFPFTFDELDLFFAKTADSISCSLSAYFTLQPPENSGFDPADLGLTISYDHQKWLLSGYIDNLSCGLLYSFFDNASRDAAIKVLSKLTISSLDMVYTYDSSGGASSFLITGTITLGKLALRLFYQYASSNAGDNSTIKAKLPADGPKLVTATGTNKDGTPNTEWKFECDLGASNGDATIQDIASSICDDVGTLPSFIGDIKVPSATGRGLISLTITSPGAGSILFALTVTISPVTLTFLQTSYSDKTKPTKRLIRFAVDKIPMIQNIPLLNKLPQPFDQLEYVWVNDVGGWLQSEVDAINDPNTGVLSGADILLCKAASKPDGSKDAPPSPSGVTPPSVPDPFVILPGHHFMVVQNGQLVIDHVFFAKPTKSQHSLIAGQIKDTVPQEPAPSPPTKGALSFTFGPLAISAVTLQFKEQSGGQSLCVSMDATFTMGPISFSLLGFTISVPLDSIKLDNLVGALDAITVSLNGMALSFDKPPLLLAGAFEHNVIGSGKDRQEIYLGGISLSFPPYTFVGLGEYAILNDYKSVFIYCKLDGPLVTLEFATISGVRLGLGYNSVVKSPSIDELTQFPFINDHSASGTGNDPINILKAMTTPGADPVKSPAWVTPKIDSYWLAVGMSVIAFDILNITAVAMFAFRDSGLVMSIYADAIAQMPPSAPKEACIVYVELGMVAEMNLVDGYFRVEASLAPTSFLLVPECHIYGGFALVYWFPPNDHAGDWVFTVGGYHKDYSPPAWYPTPKRLGISFSVGPLSITGESYFAVTPKCAMGGAMLHASMSVGPISAWLDATFDALVNFHPLHYSVDFSVSIGVEFHLDIGLIHIHVSASVSAGLHIEGPQFGGVAHVDFYLFGFDVYFGAQPSGTLKLDLQEFWDMLHKPGPQPSPDDPTAKQHASPVRSFVVYSLSRTPFNEPGAAFKFVLENGNFPMPKTPDSTTTTPATGGGGTDAGGGGKVTPNVRDTTTNTNPGSTQPSTDTSNDPTSTGAGAKWFVKGGSFQFRIACDFAISKALITLSPDSIAANKAAAAAEAAKSGIVTTTGNNNQPAVPSTSPQRPIVQDDESIDFRVIAATTPAIVSRPMQLDSNNPLTSVLTVTVTNKVTGDIIDNWRSVTFAVKDMPSAIWGAYDQALDPQNTQNPSGLLNGDNATLKQSMALVLVAPPPELAVSFIPDFNASAAMIFGILDFRTDTVEGTNWILAPPEPTQTQQYLPRPLTDDEIAQSNEQRWNSVSDTWTTLAKDNQKQTLLNDPSNGCLAMCTSLFGWDQNTPQQDPPPKSLAHHEDPPTTKTDPPPVLRQPWQLLGGLPSKLIANLDTLYLDLPRMAVV